MIEIEKKFSLTELQKKALIKDAVFLGEKKFTDVYYDTPDLKLSLQDIWFRARDGKWQLKIPIRTGGKRVFDQYRELEDEKEILEALKITGSGSFLSLLEKNKYEILLTFKTARQKYQKGDFILDFDVADFGDSTYEIGEVELLVLSDTKMEEATQRITDLAKEFQLEITLVKGKGHEYFRRYKPEVCQKLVDAGIFKSF